jgi:hypothetical protein
VAVTIVASQQALALFKVNPENPDLKLFGLDSWSRLINRDLVRLIL